MTTVRTDLDVQQAHKTPFVPSTAIPASTVQDAIERVQANASSAASVAAADITDSTATGQALITAADAAAARTTLGLGPLATASGTLSAFGSTLIDDADAAAARTTLGVGIGTNVQAYDAKLAAVAGLAVTDGNFIVGNGTTFVAESGATARTSLGLGTGDTVQVAKLGVNRAPVKDLDVSGEIRASTGILFGTDTASANTLDDYEEGTWTVQLYDDTSAGNVSATTTTGHYTKIGNIVHAWFGVDNISTTGLTGANGLFFTLPITADANLFCGGSVVLDTVDYTSFTYLVPLLFTTARAGLRRVRISNTDATLTWSSLTSGTSDIVQLYITYKAA